MPSKAEQIRSHIGKVLFLYEVEGYVDNGRDGGPVWSTDIAPDLTLNEMHYDQWWTPPATFTIQVLCEIPEAEVRNAVVFAHRRREDEYKRQRAAQLRAQAEQIERDLGK